MSNELRSTTFQLEFNGNDGITGVKTFTKAVRDADAVTDELNRTLGENTTVTVKNVQGKKELTAQARLVANQMARNETRTQRLTDQYTFMASTVGKTADEIQVLNAVQQLGVGASEKQRKQVEQSVISYQKLRDAQNQQQGSLRNSHGVMQNFGWQMQDTIVQLQMGTSAFVVLSQQGSQMAAAFGPKGAIIGAFIALAGVIGGTLFKSLQSATQKTKELDAANKALNTYLTLNVEGATELSAKFNELARTSEIVANTQLAMSRNNAMTAQAESIKLVKEELEDVNSIMAISVNNAKAVNAPISNVVAGLGRLKTKNLSDMESSFKRLNDDVSPENIENFLGYLNDIETHGKKSTKELNELRKSLVDQYSTMKKNQEILKQTEDGWKDIGDGSVKTTDKILAAFEKEASTTRKQTETLQQEYDRRMKIILDFVDSGKKSEEDAVEAATRLTKWKKEEEEKIRKKAFEKQWGAITKAFEQEASRTTKQTETLQQEYDRRYKVIKAYTEKSDHDAEAAAKAFADLETWKKEEEEKIRKKAYDKRWKDVVTAFEKEASRTTKQTETIEQEYSRRYSTIKAYIEKPGHDAEKAAKAFADLETWKTSEYQKEYDKRERVRRQIENAQISSRGQTDPVGAEKSNFDRNIKTLEEQKALLKADQLEEIKRINGLIEAEEERHKTRNFELAVEGVNTQIAVYSLAAQSMNNLVSLMSTGASEVEQQTEGMNAAQKAMFLTMQAIAAAQALVNGLSLGIELARNFGSFDPTTALANGYVQFGLGLGAATAGAIMGTTIAGAFDNGGYIPAGQIGAVAGFGDEFVNGTLIEGPANVTSRKDTAELLRDGGKSSGSTQLNISVENKIEGGQYRVEQVSEDRVKIIAEQVFSKNIDNGVSSSLANSNSKSAKAMRKNYNIKRNL